jgi:predicted TIM-barrel fold metal-dependent hydrolase
MKIIDPHIHLWNPYTTPRLISPLAKLIGRYPKLMDKVTRIVMPKGTVNFVGKTDYGINPHLPETYHRDTGKYKIDGYVHIQAGWVSKKPLDMANETKWLETLDDKPLAIVGEAHLHDLKNLDAVIDAHLAASSRFKGIRDMIARHPSKGVMDFNETGDVLKMDDFKKGYARLGERGLSYEAFMYSYQLPDFTKMVKKIPTTRVVLNHVGTPIALANEHGGVGKTAKEREQIKEDWYKNLVELSTAEHVQMKLSGLMMPVLGFNFHLRKNPISLNEVVDAIAPHIEYALKTFGVDRCMFASNFPMDKVSLSYEMLYDAYFKIVENYSEADKRKLFSENALAFYRVGN